MKKLRLRLAINLALLLIACLLVFQTFAGPSQVWKDIKIEYPNICDSSSVRVIYYLSDPVIKTDNARLGDTLETSTTRSDVRIKVVPLKVNGSRDVFRIIEAISSPDRLLFFETTEIKEIQRSGFLGLKRTRPVALEEETYYYSSLTGCVIASEAGQQIISLPRVSGLEIVFLLLAFFFALGFVSDIVSKDFGGEGLSSFLISFVLFSVLFFVQEMVVISSIFLFVSILAGVLVGLKEKRKNEAKKAIYDLREANSKL